MLATCSNHMHSWDWKQILSFLKAGLTLLFHAVNIISMLIQIFICLIALFNFLYAQIMYVYAN